MMSGVSSILLFVALASVSITSAVTSEDPYVQAEVTGRPPYNEYAKRARYIVNRANWTVLATFSFHEPVTDFPYARVESCVDGALHKGTGTPYFYLMENGTPMQNINKRNNVTISYSEAEFPDISDCKALDSSDPQSPLCARLMMYGRIYPVTDKAEFALAQGALFSRHPFMKGLPFGHHFKVYGLDIEHIFMLDFFGGAVSVSVKDYYKAKWQ